MSIFDHESAARRYALGRPYFHPLVIEKIVAYTGIARCGQAVDVCCGTGQSTLALKQIAARVTGMDIAPEMLRLAPALEDTRWICCPAEKLTADDASCDLMTVALAFHWLDRHEFLREAWRVLRTSAWLVIYNNWFCGTMLENVAFADWNKNVYLKRYPTPPRDYTPLTKDAATAAGFDFAHTEEYTNEVRFSVKELACYLSTQSNMITAIEAGRETAANALAWLHCELAPMFRREKERFAFAGNICYLRKATVAQGS